MRARSQRHNTFALLLICSLPILFRLDAGEVQAWDEALFALRAQTISLFGDVWDQTEHAPGGLYSSTYPPLTMWMMAGAFSLFGPDAFAIRLFAALCAIAGIVLIYGIARRLVSRDIALMTAALLAGSLQWNTYGRMGMTDVPVVTFALLALWSVLKICEEQRSAYVRRWTALLAVAVAAGLMSKIVVSLLPLLFIGMAWRFAGPDRVKRRALLIAGLIGIGLALPWHLMMAARHGLEFASAFVPPHLTSAVEGPRPLSGWWYYLNQLLIGNPFSLFALVGLLVTFKPPLRLFRRATDNWLLATVTLWFGLGLLVFSFATTKMPHYTLLLLPPAVFLAAYTLEQMMDSWLHRRAAWAGILGLLACCVWALAPALRTAVKDAFGGGSAVILGVFMLVLLLALLSGMLLKQDLRESIMARTALVITFGLPVVLILNVMRINADSAERHADGAWQTAQVLEYSGRNSFVYLTHQRNDGDLLGPQLGWYTRGWPYGWRPERNVVSLGIPEYHFDENALQEVQHWPNDLLVYHYSPLYGAVHLRVRQWLEARRPLLLQTNRYLVFGAIPAKP